MSNYPDDFKGTPYDDKSTELDALEASISEDDLDGIIRLKEDLVIFIDAMARRVENCPKRFFSPSNQECEALAALMEEQFDDFWHSEWYRLAEISKSTGYPIEIPSCNFLRTKMQRDQKAAREARSAERRISESNMALANELGFFKKMGAA